MTTPDWFGFANPATPKLLSAPDGFSDVHQAGFSWAKQGGTVDETTWIEPEHWNRMIAQMRALLSVSGVDVSDLSVNSNLLLKTFIIRTIAAVLDGADIEGVGAMLKADYDPEATGRIALGAGGTGVAASDNENLRDQIGVTDAITAGLSDLVTVVLGGDADFASTMTDALAGKLSLSGGTMLGAVTLSVAPTEELHAASKGYVDAAGAWDAILEDQKPANTTGGTFTSGSWRTRTLNTEVYDPDGIVGLSSNQFTPSVDCEIEWRCPAHAVSTHVSRCYNITDAVEFARGNNSQSNTSSPNQTVSAGTARLIAGKAYEIQHYCNFTGTTTGFGNSVWSGGSGEIEVYTQVRFRKA